MTDGSWRVTRPVVFVAYGIRGQGWLARVAREASDHPLLAPLVGRQVIQFWAFGGEDDAPGGERVARIAPESEAAYLRDLVDLGRSAQNAAAVPGLRMNEVVVLERWSLFDPASALRSRLHDGLDKASRVTVGAVAGPHAFTFDWTALADAVRPASKPASVDADRVKAAIAGGSLTKRTLLIDRVNASSAVVSESLADDCFARLALAAAGGDPLAPPVSGDGNRRSHVFSQTDGPRAVRPVSVLTLAHPQSEFTRGFKRQLQTALARGMTRGDAEPALDPRAPELEEVARDEVKSLLGPRAGYNPHPFRLAREQAAAELVRRSLLRNDVRGARLSIARIRETLNGLRSPSQRVATTLPALLLLTPGESLGIALVVTILIAIAVALFRRPAAPPPEAAPEKVPAEFVAGAAKEWDQLCDGLAGLLDEWERATEEARAAPVAAGAAWAQQEGAYAWRICAVESIGGGRSIVPSADQYEDVAEASVRRILDGLDGESALDRAIESLAAGLLAQNPSYSRDLFLAAFSGGALAPVQVAVRSTDLLALTGRRLDHEEVLWLEPASGGLQGPLLAAEEARVRSVTRVLRHDDPARTIRIGVGEPVQWDEVLSLQWLQA